MANPSVPVARRALFLGLVTLPTANTNYHLRDLLNTALASQGAEVSDAGREVLLVADPGIDTVGGNSNDILVGDALLSTTNYGFVLPKAANVVFRSSMGNVQFGGIYVRSAGTAQKIGVTIMAA